MSRWQQTILQSLITCLLIASSVILLAGCNKSGGGNSQGSPIVGNEFHFPPESVVAKQYQHENLAPPVYKRFDQKYPPSWPKAIVFPKDTFIKDPPLELRPVRNEEMAAAGYKEYHATMIIPFANDVAVSYLEKQAEGAGFTINTSTKKQRASAIAGYPLNDGVVDIALTEGGNYRGLLKINLDPNLKDFTEVSVSILE